MASKPRKGKKPRYVLIIEDNPHHAELITEILDRHFAPVIIHTVDTIEDGLEFASQSTYDLILTGGVIGEIAITRNLPALSRLASNAPIIVISGRGDERLAAEFIKHGASEYLSKTRETLEQLPALLHKHLTKRRSKTRPTTVHPKFRHEVREAPTPSEIIREVDRITQQALSIAGPKRRKRSHSPEDMEQLDRLLGQIKRLREMASKLLA